MDHELIYDTEIAPQLMAIAKRCEKLGIPFIAAVEYAPGKMGKTEVRIPESGFQQTLVHWAARAMGNVDKLFIAVDRHAREHGHSSVYLQMLGNNNLVESDNEFVALTITKKE